MRLQEKREINTALADARKKDIDAGIDLSRKIDTLRQALPEEERKLNEWRTQAMASVQADIDQKIAEKQMIEKEVADLAVSREKLIAPLDAEWQLLEEEKIRIAKTSQDAEEFYQSAEKYKDDAKETVKKVTSLKNNAANKLKQAEAILSSASITLHNALDEELRVKTYRETVEAEISESYNMLDARAVEIGQKQVNVEFREAVLIEKEQDIINREIKLASDQAALASAAEFIKNKT